MDLFKTWEKINQEKFATKNLKKEEIIKAISKESSSTINELKKRLKYKIYWILFFVFLFLIWFALSLSQPMSLPFIGVVIVVYAIGFISFMKQYKKMDDHLNPDENVLSSMKINANSIKKVLRYENYFALFGFPLILICGALVPRLSKGQAFMEIFSDTKFLLMIIVCLAVLVPLLQLTARKMNDSAYGKHLKELEENIRKMEELY